jgi:hypothetical protein
VRLRLAHPMQEPSYPVRKEVCRGQIPSDHSPAAEASTDVDDVDVDRFYGRGRHSDDDRPLAEWRALARSLAFSEWAVLRERKEGHRVIAMSCDPSRGVRIAAVIPHHATSLLADER